MATKTVRVCDICSRDMKMSTSSKITVARYSNPLDPNSVTSVESFPDICPHCSNTIEHFIKTLRENG